jgi:hypothetical protein
VLRPNTINPLALEDEHPHEPETRALLPNPPTDEDAMNACAHPPTRTYAWRAYDGTLCIGCCDCGAVLAGSATREEKPPMSVFIVDAAELQELYSDYRAFRSDLGYGSELATFAEALFAAHLANISAFRLTYSDRYLSEVPVIVMPEVLDAAPESMSPGPKRRKAFIRSLRSLCYNCVSNGGTDFLPSNQRAVLEYAAQLVVDQLAGI